jgi:spore cortex formation protein SpoVR/YcgB (stage V sporulation)
MQVTAIHNERGYREVRKALARSYDLSHLECDIQIVDVDLAGDRRLVLQHRVANGILLDEDEAVLVLRHIANLWGYEVRLVEVDAETDMTLREYDDVAPTINLA